MPLKTKIVATIGPVSRNKATLEKLVKAGLNVARLNFSHGSYEDHSESIRAIRSISRTHNRPIAILLDLQGPKLRIGKLENAAPVKLKAGSHFCITTKQCMGTAEMVSTTYQGLAGDVNNGDTILLDDGMIRLQVASVNAHTVRCQVINGGVLKENKGINLPGIGVSAPCLTEKDLRDINFGIQNGVDYFALSFVRTPEDVKEIKKILNRQGSDIPVVAKIEKPEAVQNLEAILDVSDAIMVARGDLGVELNPELVPTIQKQIIQTSLQKNKPVITATQMLETMSQNPIPTRAEASDVANAIFDGTDAVMLSAETASGSYPIQSLKMMAHDPVEIEVKFHLADANWVRDRILAIGASACGRIFETNIRFEDAAKSLKDRGMLLRLRKDDRVRLTLKSPAADVDKDFKIHSELEVQVDDLDTCHAIMEGLGFHPEQTYEKWRETFILDQTGFCLDTMPYGTFLEIEGAEKDIRTHAASLGLNWQKRILLNYLEIFEIIRQTLCLSFKDLTFKNFENIKVDMATFLGKLEAGKS